MEPTRLGQSRPVVLFVCVKNGGKSQMAAALMRQLAGNRVEVHSGGTHPGSSLNDESVASLAEVGASVEGEHCKPIDPDVLARADRVVVLGRDAEVDPVPGMRGIIERWDTDEPSKRGIGGAERLRLIRDDIAARVRHLELKLTGD
ncbi:arsenate-mycothiol transferase ArsC [Mariniluteicoccus flavus]